MKKGEFGWTVQTRGRKTAAWKNNWSCTGVTREQALEFYIDDVWISGDEAKIREAEGKLRIVRCGVVEEES